MSFVFFAINFYNLHMGNNIVAFLFFGVDLEVILSNLF